MKILLHLFWILQINRILIGLFFAVGILWAAPYIAGQGRFVSQKGDSLGFIKEQLLYNAFRNVISQELKAMKLNNKKFWENYERQFLQNFRPISDSLKKRFSDKKGRIGDKKQYKKALRKKKLTSKSRYGNLNELIPSYSIKNTKNSAFSKKSRLHEIEIQATINRRKLHRTYVSFTETKVQKTFEQLFVSPRFSFSNIQWSELGIRSQYNFTKTIANHWQNWFQTHMGRDFQKVTITNENQRESVTNILSPDSRSFWLTVSVRIEQVRKDTFLNIKSFLINTNYLFIDLKTKKPILYGENQEKLKTIEFQNIEDLNTQLATHVYQEPVSLFGKIKSSIQSLSHNRDHIEIVVKNAPTMLDVLKLSDFISHEGIIHGVQAIVSYHDTSQSLITLSYTNNKEDIINFLKSLNKRTFIKGKTLKVDKDMIFNILIVSKQGG